VVDAQSPKSCCQKKIVGFSSCQSCAKRQLQLSIWQKGFEHNFSSCLRPKGGASRFRLRELDLTSNQVWGLTETDTEWSAALEAALKATPAR
jgi:hypothetical protein